MASRLPDRMKLFPVGLAGEIYVSVLMDESVDEVTAVYLGSGDLALVLTADQLQELARVVLDDASSEWFSLSRYDEEVVVASRGGVQTSITLDAEDLVQFRAVLASVKEIIEP